MAQESFDEKFTNYLKKRPHSPSYKSDFAELFKKNVPGTRREQGLILVAWKTGIAEQIANMHRLTSSFAYQCSRKISSSMRVSREAAEWAVNMWFVCFGERVLHKPCEVVITELPEDKPIDLTTTQIGVATGPEHEKLFRAQVRNGSRVITAFLGDDTSPTLVVPGKVGGMPVRMIASDVFRETPFVHVIMQTGILEIGGECFQGCLNLQQVVLPEGLKVIGANAFKGCRRLQRIKIPDSVERIEEGAFSQTGLQGIVIPDSVKELGTGVFEGCSDLIDADIGTGITQLPAYLFAGCRALEEVDLPGNIERIEEGAFLSCASLQDLVIPASTKYIGENAFAYVNPGFRLVGQRGSVVEYYAKEHKTKTLLVR